MAGKILPSPEFLREILSYSPDTGKLVWLERSVDKFNPGNATRDIVAKRWNDRYAGREAIVEKHPAGYLRGRVMDKVVYAHRVIWAIVHGEWPPELVDHINGNRSDNRIANLRLASPAGNARNSRKIAPKSSSFKGVYWNGAAGKWVASITVDRKKRHIGVYSSEIEAHNAYKLAAAEGHKEFANFG